MKEYLIQFLDKCLERARATTTSLHAVDTYENQAYGALVFYCGVCYYEGKSQEEEELIKLWNEHYHTEFFKAWRKKLNKGVDKTPFIDYNKVELKSRRNLQ